MVISISTVLPSINNISRQEVQKTAKNRSSSEKLPRWEISIIRDTLIKAKRNKISRVSMRV